MTATLAAPVRLGSCAAACSGQWRGCFTPRNCRASELRPLKADTEPDDTGAAEMGQNQKLSQPRNLEDMVAIVPTVYVS
jgi:hypothetical protein